MKTLSDLKRDLQIGDSLTLVEAPTMPDHKSLNLKRYVVKKQGNGVYLNADINAKTGSFLEFTNAKLTEYDGETIKTYQAGTRPMTEDEQRVFNNKPSQRPENKEKIEMELMTDSNGSYWLDKEYLKEQGMEYLMSGGSSTRSLNYRNMTIRDEQLKGQLELSYIVEKLTQ